MKIEPSRTPAPVHQLLLQTRPGDPKVPGFIVGLNAHLLHSPLLQQSMGGLRPRATQYSPALLVEPDQTPLIFKYGRELDLAKSFAKLALQNVPHGPLVVDAIWLLYGAAKIRHEWNQPDRDTGACVFKMAGLGIGIVNLAGNFNSTLAMPDHWKNGVDFIFKSGEAIYSGKTPPINEAMMLSHDQRLALPIKLMKYFDVALDPSPVYQGITTTLLTNPTTRK